MAGVKKGKLIQTPVGFYELQLKELDGIATESGMSRSAFIRFAVIEKIKSIKKDSPLKR